MRKYYTFLCCFLGLVRLAAQTTEFELENKYWNYRDRLIKDFVQIGDKPGQSITAAQLYDFWSQSDSFQYQNGVLTKVVLKDLSM
jgi:hypothetical protein